MIRRSKIQISFLGAVMIALYLVTPGIASQADLAATEESLQEGARDHAVWTEVEGALLAEDWARVEQLLHQVTDRQHSPAVEHILASIPRARTELQKSNPLSEEEMAQHITTTREAVELTREQLSAGLAMQERTSTETEAPSWSTEGRAAHDRGPVPPGQHSPDAVLTVGDSCTYNTIQEAVNAAASGDTIYVQAKTFTGAAATIDINSKSLYIWGGYDAACSTWSAAHTVLDASGEADTVVEIYGTGPLTVEIHGFDISGGETDIDHGGGIEISVDAEVSLYGTDVFNNTSDYGGGVHLTAGSLGVLEGSRIGGNSATSNGGGICSLDASVAVDDSWIGSAVLGGNTANTYGGGVFISGGELTLGALTGVGTIAYNDAFSGGGVFASAASIVHLYESASEVRDNSSTFSGGGIYLIGAAQLASHAANINDNYSSWDGAAVFASDSGTMVILSDDLCDSTLCARVNGNVADSGSWGGALASYSANFIVERTQLAENWTTSTGSVLFASGGTLTMESVLMNNNSAAGGPAVVFLQSVSGAIINDSTIAHNTDNGDAVLTLQSGDLSSQGLIVWGNDGTELKSGTGTFTISDSILQYDVDGSNNLVADPLFFDPVAANYHISPTSPAVDHRTSGSSLDIDGEARPFGDGYDAGADEAWARVGLNGNLCSYPDIASAIADASSGDTIYLPADEYNERIAVIGKNLAFVPATSDCTTVDAGAAPGDVLIDGSGSSASLGGTAQLGDGTTPITVDFDRIWFAQGTADLGGNLYVAPEAVVTLDGCWISDGEALVGGGGARVLGTLNLYGDSAVYQNIAGGFGGGIALATDAILEVIDSRVDNNSASTSGGGISNNGGFITVRAVSAQASISGNSTLNGPGGGLFDSSTNPIEFEAVAGLPVVVDDNSATTNGGGIFALFSNIDWRGDIRFTNNTAGTDGGGIFLDSTTGSITDDGSRPLFSGNTATTGLGGGAFLLNIPAVGDFLDGVDIIDNHALGSTGEGGGIYALASVFSMRNCIVSGNSAGHQGGGLALGSGSEVTVLADLASPLEADACNPAELPADTYCSEFRNNSATGGGLELGGAVALDGGSDLIVTDTAFISNAAAEGDAIYSAGSLDTIDLANVRLTGHGDSALRIVGPSILTLTHATIAGNGMDPVSVAHTGTTFTINSSIVWDNTGAISSSAPILGNGCNIAQGGIGGNDSDPLFVTTGRGAYHLGDGSPAADACASGPAVDLDGVTRPQGADWDMGAFERWGGTVSGTVLLQPVRASTAGATVQAFTAGTTTLVAETTTDAAGAFVLDLPAGSYDVVADLDLYLSAQFSGASVAEGSPLTLPDATLRGGDTDDNGTVALVDVTYVASRFGMTTEPLADINASGSVDIVDVSATASNYSTSAPTPWS